ncbi:hypothetical protein QEN19_003387 [Hanseniaspora menglaensis]
MFGVSKVSTLIDEGETKMFTENAVLSGNTLLKCFKFILIQIPVGLVYFTFIFCKFAILAQYFLLKTLFLHIPLGLIKFFYMYVEHTIYVIVDSSTLPINAVLGLKPLYHEDNPINKLLHGKSNIFLSFYANTIISDLIFPIVLNMLVLFTVCFFIAISLVLFHKFVSLFQSEKLVFKITPFKTVQKMIKSLNNDFHWIVSIIEETIRAISDIVSPIASLRSMTVKKIKKGVSENLDVESNSSNGSSGKRYIIQKGLKEYREGTFNDIPELATTVKDKLINVIKDKIEMKLNESSANSDFADLEITAPKLPARKTSSFNSSSDGSETINSVKNVENSSNDQSKLSEGTQIRRISSIELAESMPKDYFQKNVNVAEQTMITTFNSEKTIPEVSEASESSGTETLQTKNNETKSSSNSLGNRRRKSFGTP